jgi:hypothetical protein
MLRALLSSLGSGSLSAGRPGWGGAGGGPACLRAGAPCVDRAAADWLAGMLRVAAGSVAPAARRRLRIAPARAGTASRLRGRVRRCRPDAQRGGIEPARVGAATLLRPLVAPPRRRSPSWGRGPYTAPVQRPLDAVVPTSRTAALPRLGPSSQHAGHGPPTSGCASSAMRQSGVEGRLAPRAVERDRCQPSILTLLEAERCGVADAEPPQSHCRDL